MSRILPTIRTAPPGIRLQLTFWYTIVSAALLLLFCVIFYTSLQHLQESGFDTTLQMRAQQVAEGITVQDSKMYVDNIVEELPELDASAALIDVPFDKSRAEDDGAKHRELLLTSKSLLVRILDIHGTVIYQTPPARALELPSDSINQPLREVPWRGTVYGPQNRPIRLYSTVLLSQQRILGVVQVGQSLDDLATSLQRILFGLGIVTPFILILSAFVSYWLAGHAFVPIRRLARTARDIGAKDLHQRVPIPTSRDEVYELAVIFNEMVGRLEKAFAQQRRFVSDASHELRTPVAVIRNMLDVSLAQPSTAKEDQQILREVNAEAERLGHLINDLLALARADEGQVKLDHESVRVDQLVSDVVESMAPLATERELTLQTAQLQPALVLGDAARLIQIIMGLVDNALAYTNPGGEITLSVLTTSSSADIVVCDTGIGIAREDIGHIFERFYRADPARSKVAGGSGLGLSIVDWMVRAHGGKVEVMSQPGKGSTFTVTLPLL